MIKHLALGLILQCRPVLVTLAVVYSKSYVTCTVFVLYFNDWFQAIWWSVLITCQNYRHSQTSEASVSSIYQRQCQILDIWGVHRTCNVIQTWNHKTIQLLGHGIFDMLVYYCIFNVFIFFLNVLKARCQKGIKYDNINICEYSCMKITLLAFFLCLLCILWNLSACQAC